MCAHVNDGVEHAHRVGSITPGMGTCRLAKLLCAEQPVSGLLVGNENGSDRRT